MSEFALNLYPVGRSESHSESGEPAAAKLDEHDTMAGVARAAIRVEEERWKELAKLAGELKYKALLPILGAGASYPCHVPLATELGSALVGAVDAGRITVSTPPSDYAEWYGDPDADPPKRSDLGRLADLICLDNPVEVVLDELGLPDRSLWPPGEDLAKAHESEPHPCAYRILARMARERVIAETVTFNYDCHYEGALLKEGFQPTTRRRSRRQWPQRFDVVADARSNAQLIPRGEFVLNKVHGCVETWRRRRAEATDEMGRKAADASIIIRWSQLLDWRGDLWAQDLFRDRARRHVLVLIGFAGADPVIHASLRAVLDEVKADADDSEARVRVIDLRPDTLALRLLVDAGRGAEAHNLVEQISLAGSGLPETLLIILAELIKLSLGEEATARGRTAAIPDDPRDALLQLTVAAPPMMRWTAALLQSTESVVTGTAEAIDENRDDLYVPLTADPGRTLQLLQTERRLAAKLGVSLQVDDPLLGMGFHRRIRDPRVFVPTGLAPEELKAVAADGTLRDLSRRLATPRGLLPVAVATRDETLYAYAADTGQPVNI